MKIERVTQQTAEWFAHRHGRLTASLFAAAAGVSPYKSRPALYREILGLSEPFAGNDATRWGQRWEPEALKALECATGNMIDPGAFFLHDQDRWLGASPDGEIGDNGAEAEGPGYVEIKCPYGAGSPSLYSEIPAYYMPQVQGGLYVTGLKWAWFVCYVPPLNGRKAQIAVWCVWRSEDYVKWLIGLLRDFWVHVVRVEEPPAFKRGGKPVAPDCSACVKEIIRTEVES